MYICTYIYKIYDFYAMGSVELKVKEKKIDEGSFKFDNL